MNTANNNEALGQNKEYQIIVNGREKTVTDKKVTFTQVIELAFGAVDTDPKTIYTMSYKKGDDQKPEGSMVKGDTVTIKTGAIFNVTKTNKS